MFSPSAISENTPTQVSFLENGEHILEENLESIEGYVDHIIYRNVDNGYTVLVLVCNEEENCSALHFCLHLQPYNLY